MTDFHQIIFSTTCFVPVWPNTSIINYIVVLLRRVMIIMQGIFSLSLLEFLTDLKDNVFSLQLIFYVCLFPVIPPFFPWSSFTHRLIVPSWRVEGLFELLNWTMRPQWIPRLCLLGKMPSTNEYFVECDGNWKCTASSLTDQCLLLLFVSMHSEL